jgi:mRNA-degrading endonuclease toxin of MazEF toxin-antitoxin module
MVKPAKPAALAVTRGDVWLVALDPTIGSEIQKTRRALSSHRRKCMIICAP